MKFEEVVQEIANNVLNEDTVRETFVDKMIEGFDMINGPGSEDIDTIDLFHAVRDELCKRINELSYFDVFADPLPNDTMSA